MNVATPPGGVAYAHVHVGLEPIAAWPANAFCARWTVVSLVCRLTEDRAEIAAILAE